MGQLVSTTDANGKTVSSLCNGAGQVACVAYPVSTTTTCGTLAAPARAMRKRAGRAVLRRPALFVMRIA